MQRDIFFRGVAHQATCAYAEREREQANRLMQDIIDQDGRVRFHDLKAFHDCLISDYHFILRRRTQEAVLPGGWHLFYVWQHLLLRVKTSGTEMRPRPHMTLSFAEGLEWPDELAKHTRDGSHVPKAFSIVVYSDHRLWRYWKRTMQAEQIWADAVHFDFPPDFDVSGARTIHLP